MSRSVSIIGQSFSFLSSTYILRIKRFVYHFIFLESRYKLKSNGIIEWIGDLFFYFYDLILLPEIYEFLIFILKTEYRFLDDDEKKIAVQYLGKSVKLNYVRINAQMSPRIEKKAHAYVTLNTINYNTRISRAIFIHEMVHVWQYQRFGSMYIFRALKAQVSKEKYDYGGLEGLYAGMIGQKKFTSFNFEQQGAIIEDYCRLNENPSSFGSPIVNATYEYYVSQLDY